MASTPTRHLTERSSSERSLCFPCSQKLEGASGRVNHPPAEAGGRRRRRQAGSPLPAPAAPRQRPPAPRSRRSCAPAPAPASWLPALPAAVRGRNDTFPLCWEGGRQGVHARGGFFSPPLPRLFHQRAAGRHRRTMLRVPCSGASLTPSALWELTSTHLHAPRGTATTAPPSPPQDSPPPRGLSSASTGVSPWRETSGVGQVPAGRTCCPGLDAFNHTVEVGGPSDFFSM